MRSEARHTPAAWRLAKAISLLAVGVALFGLLEPPSARSQAAVKSFELRPGVVVGLDKSEAYVMQPEGGVAALDLAQGNELWRSTEAAKPLTLSAIS